MPKSIIQLHLSDEEYGYLQEQIVKGTTEARVYKRAKMLLLKAEGISFNRIADSGVKSHFRKIEVLKT